MAIEAKYTEQFPVVATPAQRDAIEAEAQERRTSMATVVRDIVDEHFGLVDGEVQPKSRG